MKTEDQNSAIAKVCRLEDKYVLIKRGLYYRPDYKGYTSDINEAGRYTEKEAQEGAYLTAGEVTFEKLPIPDYVNDLNLMHEAEKFLSGSNQSIYWNKLMLEVGPDGEVDLVDDYGEWSTSPSTSGYSIIHATSGQKAKAFLQTLSLWVK